VEQRQQTLYAVELFRAQRARDRQPVTLAEEQLVIERVAQRDEPIGVELAVEKPERLIRARLKEGGTAPGICRHGQSVAARPARLLVRRDQLE
jgi:D-alanyl-D-alanine carboxypeptidase